MYDSTQLIAKTATTAAAANSAEVLFAMCVAMQLQWSG